MKPFEPDSPPTHVREARLRSLVSLATTPMLVFDGERRYVDVNETACEVLGASRSEIIGRRIDDFTAVEGGFNLERLWARFMEDGRVNGSYPVKRFDGQVRPVVYAATADVVPGRHMAIFANGKSGSQTAPAPADDEPRRPASQLTPREREILQMIADGLTDREIAKRLVLSPATARTHARNLIGKLGAHTRAQAVAIAIRRGEISV
ncbi:MAG TPA: LuxR C-terminal-related transcriptional regulator [Thermoleophilaceae bacterium]|nr:LuxR C-terminal-related transcriptional regulator [Thermoleophilaceae bacterium]